jgi:hypothetical protein
MSITGSQSTEIKAPSTLLTPPDAYIGTYLTTSPTLKFGGGEFVSPG